MATPVRWLHRNDEGTTRMIRIRCWVCGSVGACITLAGQAVAQDATPPMGATPPQAPLVTTLEEVRALPPDEEALDLYAFDNPIKVESNRFSNSYHPPPSPKEISESGGYLYYGLGLLLEKGAGVVAKGLQKIPGIKGEVQPAIARPPPLDLEQMERAARIRQSQDAAAPNE